MRRLGWHLDDVPQPFLTVRRAAFAALVLAFVLGAPDGLLLAYDLTQGRAVVLPLVAGGVLTALAMVAGGFFGWTNQKSPRWREWRKSNAGMTPGWPPDQ
jgi:hypothetical protein